jgi:hypothetical protein
MKIKNLEFVWGRGCRDRRFIFWPNFGRYSLRLFNDFWVNIYYKKRN